MGKCFGCGEDTDEQVKIDEGVLEFCCSDCQFDMMNEPRWEVDLAEVQNGQAM